MSKLNYSYRIPFATCTKPTPGGGVPQYSQGRESFKVKSLLWGHDLRILPTTLI